MSMQNFPRVPKITLRTPTDQAKDVKNAMQQSSVSIEHLRTDRILHSFVTWHKIRLR